MSDTPIIATQKDIRILVNGEPVLWCTRASQITVSIDGVERYELVISEKKSNARLEKA